MLGTANAGTDLTVYTVVEAEYLKKYAARFNEDHLDININWVRDSIGIYTVCHPTATTALKQMDAWLESVAVFLKQPFYRTFLRVTIPVRTPAILDISIYLFVSAMMTVSAIALLFSAHTRRDSIAVLNMDDAGDIVPAAAMGMMIIDTAAGVKVVHYLLSRGIEAKTLTWRSAVFT